MLKPTSALLLLSCSAYRPDCLGGLCIGDPQGEYVISYDYSIYNVPAQVVSYAEGGRRHKIEILPKVTHPYGSWSNAAAGLYKTGWYTLSVPTAELSLWCNPAVYAYRIVRQSNNEVVSFTTIRRGDPMAWENNRENQNCLRELAEVKTGAP